MSSEWPVQRLDQIAEINPARKVRKGSVVPFVDMAALPQHSRDIGAEGVLVREAKGAGAHFQNGDTLLARITPCLENGKTAQVRCLDGDAIAEGSTEFIVLCGKDPEDNDFIYYLCREPAFREYAIGRMEGTSGRQRVSWQSIAAYEFAFPPPDERRAAACVLSALDDRITLLRETNATLEAIAQALFKSWFVDFDPVRAKMEGRAPEGMDEATAALFPDALEETELGPVPRGWRVGIVSDLAKIKGGKQLEKSSFSDGFHNPVFGGAGVMGYTDLSNADGLVITVGRVGAYCGQFFWHFGRAWVNNNASRIDPTHDGHGLWLYQWLQQADIESIKKGAAQPFVSNSDISAMKLVIPTDEAIRLFVGTAEALYERMQQNNFQAQTLATLRDTLLPRLISGQLRVPEAIEATLA